MQVAIVVVPGEHETALAQAVQQTPAGIQRGQQDVAQLPRRLHQPGQLLDPHPEHRGPLHGHPGEEGPLPHQHAQLAHEVAFLDHEDDAVVPAVEKQDATGEDEVQVVGVTGVPQQLAGLGVKHLTGRPQQLQGGLAEHRERNVVDTVLPWDE